MIPEDFLAGLSHIVAIRVEEIDGASFAGINVILCGDQPVPSCSSISLLSQLTYLMTPLNQIEQKIYEEFTTVVILRKQHRVSDPE
jgi:hypothetical protein